MRSIDMVLMIVRWAKRYSVDPELALQICWLESSLNPRLRG